MAFIPDDAEDRFNELSPSAERFYIYLCRTRNHKTQRSFAGIDKCAEKYQWSRATKFGVQKELIEKGWISKDEAGWALLIGDFSPVNQSNFLDSESKFLDLEQEQSKKLDNQSKKLDSPIYKELTSLINQKTQTANVVQSSADTDEAKVEKKATAILLPEDFSITESMRRWAGKEASNVDIDAELNEFKRFWCYIATKNNKRTARGWVATWQNRMAVLQKQAPLPIIKPKSEIKTIAEREAERNHFKPQPVGAKV